MVIDVDAFTGRVAVTVVELGHELPSARPPSTVAEKWRRGRLRYGGDRGNHHQVSAGADADAESRLSRESTAAGSANPRSCVFPQADPFAFHPRWLGTATEKIGAPDRDGPRKVCNVAAVFSSPVSRLARQVRQGGRDDDGEARSSLVADVCGTRDGTARPSSCLRDGCTALGHKRACGRDEPVTAKPSIKSRAHTGLQRKKMDALPPIRSLLQRGDPKRRSNRRASSRQSSRSGARSASSGKSRRAKKAATSPNRKPSKSRSAAAAEALAKHEDKAERECVSAVYAWADDRIVGLDRDLLGARGEESHLRTQDRQIHEAKMLRRHLARQHQSVPSALQLADALLTLELAGKQPSATLQALSSLGAMERKAHTQSLSRQFGWRRTGKVVRV